MTRNIQHHHHIQSDHDEHYLHTTPGKPLSLSSSKSSFRPRTASTLFVSILSTFLFSWESFSIIHYCAPVYKLGSVSYPEILSQCQNSFFTCLEKWGFFFSSVSPGARPVGHVVEVLGELRQVHTLLLRLRERLSCPVNTKQGMTLL